MCRRPLAQARGLTQSGQLSRVAIISQDRTFLNLLATTLSPSMVQPGSFTDHQAENVYRLDHREVQAADLRHTVYNHPQVVLDCSDDDIR